MARYVDEMITRFLVEGQDSLAKAFTGAADAAGNYSKKWEKAGQTMDNIAPFADRLAVAGDKAQQSALGWVNTAGTFEQARVGFTTMLGSTGAAEKFMGEVKRFAVDTPFNLLQVQDKAKQLLGVGFSEGEVLPTLRAVGDAVSALGGGEGTLDGVVRAMMQMKALGTLKQGELNQLAQAGIPAMEILQQKMGLTAEQMAKITSQGVPAEKAIKLLVEGMNERYGGGMDKQSKTFLGIKSSLEDAGVAAKDSLGQPLIEPMTAAAKQVQELLMNVEKLPPALKTTAAYGTLLGGTVVKTGGQALNAYKEWKEYRAILDLAKNSKKGLEAATKADNIAEIAKTGTAKKEAEAIGGVAKSAKDALKSKNDLAKAASGATNYVRGGADASLGGWLTGGLGVKGLLGANAGTALTGLGAGATISTVTLAAGTAVLGWEVGKALADWMQGNSTKEEQADFLMGGNKQSKHGYQESGAEWVSNYTTGSRGKDARAAASATDKEIEAAQKRARKRLEDNDAYQARARSRRAPNGDLHLTVRGAGYGGQQVRDHVTLR